ncbi:MAG: hypothetical protein J6Y94_05225 [Bacteriovoracaceae bacterium]|nr:hypothetical protein [Bacteriovoracaceae bacterium]
MKGRPMWNRGRKGKLGIFLGPGILGGVIWWAGTILMSTSGFAAERIIDIDKGQVELELVNLPYKEVTYTIARTGRCPCQIKEEGSRLKISHGKMCPATNRVKIYIPAKLAEDLQINLGAGQIHVHKAKPWDTFNNIVAQTTQGSIVAEDKENLISTRGKQGKILERTGSNDKVNLTLSVQNGMINF